MIDNIPKTGVTFVKFGAEWCGPCKMLDKTFDTIQKEDSTINVLKYDIDEHIELAGNLGIMSVPTVQVYRNGEYEGKFVGAVQPAMIKKIIDGTQTLSK